MRGSMRSASSKLGGATGRTSVGGAAVTDSGTSRAGAALRSDSTAGPPAPRASTCSEAVGCTTSRATVRTLGRPPPRVPM